MTTTVLIVEDEGLWRDMLTLSLSAKESIKVVGSAADGASGIRVARELSPQVVLMDIELGAPPNGIEAGLEIKRFNPKIGIVIFSAHAEKEYLNSIPLHQASGWSYLMKQSVSDLNALVRAIEGAAAGLMILDPALVSLLKPRPSSRLSGLTPRQLEVLELMAQGHSNASIAQKLVLTEKSVENYVNAIYEHLIVNREDGIHPRVKAVITYIQDTQQG